MKILLVVNNIKQIGGVERVINNLGQDLSKYYNFDVSIASLFDNSPSKASFKENPEINYISMNFKSKSRIIKNGKRIFSLAKYIKRNNIDVVICNSVSISVLCIILKLSKIIKNNVKIISFEHSQYYHISKFYFFMRKFFYKFLDQVVTLTKFDQNLIKSEVTNKVINISNYFREPEFIKNYSINRKKVIGVGRLESEKQFSDLIRAFSIAKLRTNNNEWTLEIIGEGSERNKLENIIKKLDMSDYVVLSGATENIAEKYNEAAFLVSSSKSESFGMVILEAMSYKVPCISYNCMSGPGEIIKHDENGILVQNNDIDELTNAILTLMTNENKRKYYSGNCNLIHEKYNKENILFRWNENLKNIHRRG